ncbi:unnamed protein product [Symbiodinium pilosum]|uniref:Uncharacterized protein n=1 Tax=Symbiodinium pilosum TaxID=2952 RepID=A0A812K1W6_SYMPI|nr:unnamed protein product [Symbiodinium pilosum]
MSTSEMPTDGEEEQALTGLWYVGIGLQVISSMCGTAGKTLVRLSTIHEKKHPFFSKLLFRVGLLTNTIIGPLIDVSAYSFAPQSLVAPFGGLDVVWNALLAPFILKEKLTKHRAVGSALVMMGSVGSAAFGNQKDPIYTLQYIEDTMINLRVLIYFLVFISWYLFNQFYLMRWPTGSIIKGLSYGWTAGSLAGNMWCTKIAIELVQTSIALGDPEPWKTWIPYAALLGAAFFAVVNAYFLTKGLQHYEAFFMIPIVEGSMILSASLSGAIVLLDVRGLEAWRICMYSLCVLLVIFGMITVFLGEASSKSSLMSGNASIAGSDRKDKAEKAVAIQTVPPSPQGSTTSYTVGRVHIGVPPSPTTSTISDKEGNGRLRAISSEDIENGIVVIHDRAPHPPTIAESEEDCIRLDHPPPGKKQKHVPAPVIGAAQLTQAPDADTIPFPGPAEGLTLTKDGLIKL